MSQYRRFIRDHYQRVIREIMETHGIQPADLRPTHHIFANTTLRQVAQYTHWFIAGGGRGQRPHYRYDSYMNRLPIAGIRTSTGHRLGHIDIGCGPGLFSWVFLDWLTTNGFGLDRVDLYGLDHCKEMLSLAEMSRNQLELAIPNYPELHCSHSVDDLVDRIAENHRPNTDYVVTFGHVLVQTRHNPAIQGFARVVLGIVESMHPGTVCTLVAIDAVNQPDQLHKGWTQLLDELGQNGLYSHQEDISYSNTKVARLYPTGEEPRQIDDIDDLPF